MPFRNPLFPGVARIFPSSLGSSEPGIPFWPRFDAFPRSGMRASRPHPVVCTCPSECDGTDSHAWHSGVRYFPELRVYSRVPLGLVNLGLHFGRVIMRFLKVGCERASLALGLHLCLRVRWD